MKRRINLLVDAEADDFYEGRGYVKGRVYEALWRMMQVMEDGSLASPRAFSLRTGKAVVDLQGYYEKHQEDFGRYLGGARPMTVGHRNALISALDRNLVGGKVPAEIWKLSERVNTSKFTNGVRDLFHFMRREGEEKFRGVEIEKWVRGLHSKASTPDRRRPSDEMMMGLADSLEEDILVWFRALAYSGTRVTQLWGGLKLLEKREEHEGFFKIPIGELSKGKKGGEFIYLPMWLLPELLELDVDVKYNTLTYMARRRGFMLKSMRKWNANFMRRQKVEVDARHFIHGWGPKTTEEDHYLDLVEHADKAYKELLPKFPEWLRKSEGGSCG